MQLDNYVDVPSRLRAALKAHPELRVAEAPPEVVKIGDAHYIAVTITVWRDPDDPVPAVATAWEPWPGKTNFTRDSEMMNASTSALGRALGFMGYGLAGPLASKEEVAHRLEDRPTGPAQASGAQLAKIAAALGDLGIDDREERLARVEAIIGRGIEKASDLTKAEASKVIDALKVTQ